MNKIKKATLGDLESLAPLFNAYRVFYEQENNIEAARHFLKDRILKNESEIFIGYSPSDIAVGFVQLYPSFSSTRMKRLWLLNDLYVDHNYRGQGISKQLIEMGKQLCHDTDACGLLLETAKSNTIGNQLYPSTGFTLDNEHHYYSWDYNPQ
jgi:GNAT superfamily N-acetyltransferase